MTLNKITQNIKKKEKKKEEQKLGEHPSCATQHSLTLYVSWLAMFERKIGVFSMRWGSSLFIVENEC